jgi:hypothetical protein
VALAIIGGWLIQFVCIRSLLISWKILPGFQGLLFSFGCCQLWDNADFMFLQVEHKLFYVHVSSRMVENVYELCLQQNAVCCQSIDDALASHVPSDEQ